MAFAEDCWPEAMVHATQAARRPDLAERVKRAIVVLFEGSLRLQADAHMLDGRGDDRVGHASYHARKV